MQIVELRAQAFSGIVGPTMLSSDELRAQRVARAPVWSADLQAEHAQTSLLLCSTVLKSQVALIPLPEMLASLTEDDAVLRKMISSGNEHEVMKARLKHVRRCLMPGCSQPAAPVALCA